MVGAAALTMTIGAMNRTSDSLASTRVSPRSARSAAVGHKRFPFELWMAFLGRLFGACELSRKKNFAEPWTT
jgi:hypothetical protein